MRRCCHLRWFIIIIVAILLLCYWQVQAHAQNTQSLYFNARGQVVAMSQAAYRRDYKAHNQNMQVQDFYYPSGKPYSNVFVLPAPRLKTWTPQLNQGELILWHENGRQKVQGTFKNGQLDGQWLSWHNNGQLAATIHYHQGQAEGVGTRWYTNGQKESQMLFEHGKANGRWR